MFSPNFDTQAIDLANNALSIIEQMSLLCDQLELLEQTIDIKSKAEVVALAARARAILAAIDDSDSQAVLSLVKEERQVTKLGRTKIENLGIGNEVIRLKEELKMSYREIAEKFNLSEGTVARFYKLYEQSKPLERSRVRSKSVMDFVNNWETLGAMIYRQLARLESDPENHVKYISELRQLSKDVAAFQTKYTAQQQVEQIKEIAQEILSTELPHRKQEIALRFMEVGIGKYLQPAK